MNHKRTAFRGMALFMSFLIFLTPSLFAMNAEDYASLQRQQAEKPNIYSMTADAVIARPLLLLATVAGTGLFIVSLPFSALGGNVSQAGHELVVAPARATFVRCLGCTESGRAQTTVASNDVNPRTGYRDSNGQCPRSELNTSGICGRDIK